MDDGWTFPTDTCFLLVFAYLSVYPSFACFRLVQLHIYYLPLRLRSSDVVLHSSVTTDYVNDVVPKTELQLPLAQALALFVKVVRKISKRLVDIQKAAIGASIPKVAVAPTSRVVGERNAKTDWTPIGTSLDEELTQAGNGATNALREKQREMIDSLDLNK